jgi:pyruvate dehydrogenase E1 component
LIGIGQPNLLAFEPAYVDEMAVIMRFAFEHLQAEDGGSVYLRLSTRPVEQPERAMTEALAAATLEGAYWLREPAPGCELALVGMGALMPEVLEAADQLDDLPGLGVLVVTSADRLHADWRAAQSRRVAGGAAQATIERLLAPLARDAALVTVLDGHPATLAWLGSASARRVYPLGVDRFGQSGDVPDLYRDLQIDAAAILDRAALACRDALAR